MDGQYPDADIIILVMDNLNIHKPPLYKRYPATEARRQTTQELSLHPFTYDNHLLTIDCQQIIKINIIDTIHQMLTIKPI